MYVLYQFVIKNNHQTITDSGEKQNMIPQGVVSAGTDFEYSKDWLVTESHRLSSCLSPAPGLYTSLSRENQYPESVCHGYGKMEKGSGRHGGG